MRVQFTVDSVQIVTLLKILNGISLNTAWDNLSYRMDPFQMEILFFQNNKYNRTTNSTTFFTHCSRGRLWCYWWSHWKWCCVDNNMLLVLDKLWSKGMWVRNETKLMVFFSSSSFFFLIGTYGTSISKEKLKHIYKQPNITSFFSFEVVDHTLNKERENSKVKNT